MEAKDCCNLIKAFNGDV
ncbi:Protein of unknown function [Bacillus mobilis]|nr:Protein of unknown function [Bacillus mobilis]